MDPTILIFALAFSIGIGLWANSWGRNGWAWGIASAFISPLIAAIILLFAGKTLEKKAAEAKYINDLVNK